VERSKSYYDWQQSLKWKQTPKNQKTDANTNSLGINDLEFKKYLKKWKQVNL